MTKNKLQTILGTYPVQLRQTVIWGDMDAFQHVNNKVYFRYFEDIRIEFMVQTKMLEMLDQSRIGPILASTSCDFRAPLSYPDNIYIGARISNMQARKISMEYVVVSEKLNKIAAEGTGLIVYYDYEKGQSCAVPEKIKRAVQKL